MSHHSTTEDTLQHEQSLSPVSDIEQLRELIMGREARLLSELRERLDDPALRADELADVLVETIRISQAKGENLAAAIEEPVQACIKQSIEKDTQFFADALFPVMGPAIRRSINESLKAFIQSVNAAIENRFSTQRLKWEWEAKRSGLSYGEVVLKHTLVYRVEQVLLVQRSTGLLVQHVERPDIDSKDGDAVSAMLTAIQDFVRDSFAPEGEQGGDLGSVSVGDQTVWLVNSPDLTMACVIRGIAPVSLRIQLQGVLEDLLLQHTALVSRFDGDREPMQPLVPELERCFGYVKTVDAEDDLDAAAAADLDVEEAEFTDIQDEPEPAKPNRLKTVLKTPFFYIALVVVVLVLWVFIVHQLERNKKSDLLAQYAQTPGIVVIGTHWKNVDAWGFWKYFHPGRTLVVEGLQDLSFNDADSLAKQQGYADERIDIRMQPYLSLAADAQLQRAQAYFKPPSSVQLSLQGTQVFAAGAAKRPWLEKWTNTMVLLPGIKAIDLSKVSLDLSDEYALLKQEQAALEQLVLYFKDSHSTAQSFEATIAELLSQLQQYQQQAMDVGYKFKLEVTAYSDQLGGEALNLPVRQARAKQVWQALVDSGFDAQNIILRDGGALGLPHKVDRGARKVTIAIKSAVP